MFDNTQRSSQGRSLPGNWENREWDNEQAFGDTGEIERQRKLHLHPEQRKPRERNGPRAEW